MSILFWILGGLMAWCTFGCIWLKIFPDEEESEEYQECPYE